MQYIKDQLSGLPTINRHKINPIVEWDSIPLIVGERYSGVLTKDLWKT